MLHVYAYRTGIYVWSFHFIPITITLTIAVKQVSCDRWTRVTRFFYASSIDLVGFVVRARNTLFCFVIKKTKVLPFAYSYECCIVEANQDVIVGADYDCEVGAVERLARTMARRALECGHQASLSTWCDWRCLSAGRCVSGTPVPSFCCSVNVFLPVYCV